MHALYQTAFYERLASARRRQLHQQIGEWQESAYGTRTKNIAAELATHFIHGQDYQRAIQYLGQAAQNATWTYGYHEAITHLTAALALLSHLPASPERAQRELALQVGLSLSLMNTQGFVSPVTEQAYTRTHALCQEAGDSLHRFAALWGLRNFHTLRGALRDARAAAQEFREGVQRTQMSVLAAEAALGLGTTSFHLGECVEARSHLEQSLTLYNPQACHRDVFLTGQDPRASGLSHLAVLLWILGYPDQARERIHQAQMLAHDALFPYGQALTLGLAAVLQLCHRDPQAVEQLAEASHSFARQCGFRHLLVMGTVLRGWALVMQGQSREGVGLIEEGLAQQHGMGIGIGGALYQILLAEAHAHSGHTEAALQALAEAFTAVERTEERTYEAELYRRRGDLILQQCKSHSAGINGTSLRPLIVKLQSEAETCFLTAIDIARCQGAKSFELRAATSLSRLWQCQGKTKKAQLLLSGIYEWFTEGFDTPDLQDAKALLEELRCSRPQIMSEIALQA
jgi:predicted ATPase